MWFLIVTHTRCLFVTGFDYWSVTLDRGATLPLTTLALDNALMEWGIADARALMSFYFDSFIFANGK